MPSDEELLVDMIVSAREARDLAVDRSYDDLVNDRTLQLPFTKLVEIVGEAARAVSDETRKRAESVPWSDIVAMRHRLVHDYRNTRLEILWDVVTRDLPILIETLELLMESPEEDADT
ncbi:MAG: DUF86 domain-containing protein [Chloroflexi bacterium]|nr:DUF86 domain-containing protein [Chloroflexota bacterium]